MQISVINYKKLNIEAFRFDAEYYHPKYLRIESVLKQRKDSFTSLTNLGLKIDASAFYPALESYYNQGKLPFLRVVDVDQQIDYDSALTIPEEILKEYKTLKTVNQGDILLTKGGSVGRVGLIQQRCAVTRDLIFINSSKLDRLDYVTLFIYTLTDFYNNMLIRSSSLTAQPHLTLTLVKHIPIYRPTGAFKALLLKLFEKQNKAHDLSLSLYQDAEQALLSELGLLYWKPRHRLSFIKKYSDTDTAGRIDAEYFQPMYEEILIKLKSGFDASPIGEYDFIHVTTGQYSDEYVSESEGKPYIRGTDLSKGTVLTDSLVYIDKKKQEKSKIAKEGDVVVTRVGTIGLSACIPKECDGGTISDNLIRLRFDNKRLNSNYTAIFLGSILGRSLMIGHSRGSVQQRLNQETLKEIIFPIPKMDTQNKISETVLKSDEKRKESKFLLNIAKRGVEMAIEKSEKDAKEYIRAELEKFDINL